jgi:hypothetical protein
MSQIYSGSCHCGQIKFEASGELNQVMECNCSICRRKGAKMWFVPRAQFKLLSKRDALATYTFNTHRIQHHFCPTCGIAPFGEGTDPKGNEMAAINARCLADIELENLPVQRFDGASL